MKTLATNPRKAALVRFLTIEYTYITNGNLNCEQEMTTYLLKSLINMHSLSDFRLFNNIAKLGNMDEGPEQDLMVSL